MSLDKNKDDLEHKSVEINRDLIEKVRNRDRKAQFEVYKRYYKAMYNTALRILKNTAEAEDIMQDSFLDAFGKIDQFDGKATFGSWLKRIVINKSIDTYKRRKETISIEDSGIDVADLNEEDYLEVLSYKVDEIRNGIENLPDDYRIIVSLYLLEGYDHEEISEILNISYENSRTRYSRAKKKLLRDLNEKMIQSTVN